MTKMSDVAVPSLLITEGTEPAAPAAGKQRLYIDSTTHTLHRTDSSGTEVDIESAGAGSVATDAIWDAKGDLAGGTGADTAARLAVGTNGHSLIADSTQTTGLKWGQPAGTLLGYVADTSGDKSITSATMADVPATTPSVTFTAPASGNVLIRLSATAGATSSANALHVWGIREGSTTLIGATGQSIAVRQHAGATEGFYGVTKVFVLTGISAGSHTYKWAAACSTSGGTFKANTDTPAVMEVWAL